MNRKKLVVESVVIRKYQEKIVGNDGKTKLAGKGGNEYTGCPKKSTQV